MYKKYQITSSSTCITSKDVKKGLQIDDKSISDYRVFLWNEYEEELEDAFDYYIRTYKNDDELYVGEVVTGSILDEEEENELFDLIEGALNSYILYNTF